jgi:hypothetical protein
MWEGGLMAQLDAVDTAGTVTLHSEEFAATGNAEFDLRWGGSVPPR